MSVKHTAWVWEHSKAEGGTLLVALALADSVNALGGEDECWPKQSLLADRTRLSERQVQRAVVDLRELGEIEVRRERSGNHYRLLMPQPDKLSPDTHVVHSPTPTSSDDPTPTSGSMEEPELRTGKEPERADHNEQRSLIESPEDELFVRWQRIFDRWETKLTPARRKAAQKALREEPNLDALEEAMRGFKVHRRSKSGGIELGDIFGTFPGSSDLRSKIEWARRLASQESSGDRVRPRELLHKVPSELRVIVMNRVNDVIAGRESGSPNLEAERVVREKLGIEIEVADDGRALGWKYVA